MDNNNIIKKINQLKKEKNAIILVHNYQRPEIYEVADFIGDSLALSKKAAETDADIIIFCGVKFMAETAKILSPEKKVILPDMDAGCFMADMINADDVRELKEKHPGVPVVSYVNTTAEVKAESDICCTSANAVKVVESLPNEEVIFLPDKNLGQYVQSKTDKKIILSEGYCYVHNYIMPDVVKGMKIYYPESVVMAHPECTPDVLALADEVFSTSGMVKYAKESGKKEFVVITEKGMAGRLRRGFPDKIFHELNSACVGMKKITLQKVLDSIENEQFEINVDENIRVKAKKALDRMLEIR